MLKGNILKPKRRSSMRLFVGKIFYTVARWFVWRLNASKYAKELSPEHLAYECTSHSTPLYRQLKNVDMWMQENKVINLRIATEKINGLIIYPGETFSYWKCIGSPSKRRGFKEGMILYCGTFKPGVGGGLCQLSNMIFWMALHSPLTVVERHRHSYDVFPDEKRKLPFGSGATCVYNYRDLQLRSDTDYPIQIIIQLTDTDLEGKILTNVPVPFTYEVYEKEHVMNHHYWGGYTRHNILYRKVFQDNVLTADEYILENHALMMYQPFLAEDKGADNL
jgi:vancomycin resistance protein VanW